MVAPLKFAISDEAIGLVGRSGGKPGPEQRLVDGFIEWIQCELDALPGPTEWAIFQEPALVTGYPDLVLAEYDPKIYEHWPHGHLRLQKTEIRIAHMLHNNNGLPSRELEERLGLKSKRLLESLERLLDAELIEWRDGNWKCVSLEKVFGIKRLVAIEAKMSNWQSAFRQAALNGWFASETYVLLPVQRPTAKVLQRAETIDVGVYLCNDSGVREVQRPRNSTPLPACYVSWFFNEWLGRNMNLHCGSAAATLN